MIPPTVVQTQYVPNITTVPECPRTFVQIRIPRPAPESLSPSPPDQEGYFGEGKNILNLDRGDGCTSKFTKKSLKFTLTTDEI